MSDNRKFKVGDKVKVIKYRGAHFDGIIVGMDPTMSANGKRVISYWFKIKPLVTIDYFCQKGEVALFTRSDIIKQ